MLQVAVNVFSPKKCFRDLQENYKSIGYTLKNSKDRSYGSDLIEQMQTQTTSNEVVFNMMSLEECLA